MGLIKITKAYDANNAGVALGHIIRVFQTGTATLVAEYAPELASPITAFQTYDVTLPNGTYDFEYINPNVLQSSINPRLFFYDSTKGYALTELNGGGGVYSISAGHAQKFAATVGTDTLYLSCSNRKLSDSTVIKTIGTGTKQYGTNDGSNKTLNGVSISLGSSYYPTVEFQDFNTSTPTGLTLPNSNAYPQFNYYIAPAQDSNAPTNVYIPVNNATGAYVRIDTQPTKGTLSNLNPQTGVVSYTPNAGATGTDSFTYSIISSNGSVLSTATETINITGQGQTVLPKFAERAYGLTDNIKVFAPSGVFGGVAKLYKADGTFLTSATDSTNVGYAVFNAQTFVAGQKIKATWTEPNKTESDFSAELTIYAKPVAQSSTHQTYYNTAIVINVLQDDLNVANLVNF